MKIYQLVQKMNNEMLKPIAKYYSLDKAKLRKLNFEKVYPGKKFSILLLKK